MYFSRIRRPIEHNLSHINVGMQVGNIGDEHSFIWGLFPHDKDAVRDFLYRRFDADGFQQFFVLSKRKPLASQAQWVVESKPYEPKIEVGSRLHFNLRANPVVTKMPEGTTSKKRKREDVFMDGLAKNRAIPESDRASRAEVLNESATRWLVGRSEQSGFSVSCDSVLVEGYQRFEIAKRKDNNKIQIGVVDFSGILTVTNAGLFYKTLNQGLGKSKAFGCGLMMIKKV